MKPIFIKLSEKPPLPHFPMISIEDRYSLDQKLLQFSKLSDNQLISDEDSTGGQNLATQSVLFLTPDEVNVLLSRFKPVPAKGIALYASHLIFEENKATLICQGSGFLISDLRVFIDFSESLNIKESPIEITGLKINNFEISSPFEKRITTAHLKYFFETASNLSLETICSSFQEVDISSQGVTIRGDFKKLFEKVN